MAISFIGEETGVSRENHRPAACHGQTLSHNVVSSTPWHRNIKRKTKNKEEKT